MPSAVAVSRSLLLLAVFSSEQSIVPVFCVPVLLASASLPLAAVHACVLVVHEFAALSFVSPAPDAP